MRICARSGCSSPAAAILTYDREAQIAYLHSVDDPFSRTPGDLCARHLARFVLPRSWTLDDRRQPADSDALDVEPAAPRAKAEKLRVVPDPARRAARTTARKKWTEVVPSLFDAPAADTAAVTPRQDDAADAGDDEPVWMPRFGPDSELDGVLDAKTPLLRRAFGGS